MSDSIDARQFARALNAWARTDGRGCRTGGGRDGLFTSIQLHWHADPHGPESHLTLEATSVDGRPEIRVTSSNFFVDTARPARSSVAVLGRRTSITDPLPGGREPDAVCESCGAAGTIGRAARTDPSGEPIEIHRFCRNCWPEQSARYRARWTEEDRLRTERFLRGLEPGAVGAGPGMSFEAATWHATLEVVRDIDRSLRAPMRSSVEDVKDFADAIRRVAPQFDGEMPLEVQTFLQRYAPEGR